MLWFSPATHAASALVTAGFRPRIQLGWGMTQGHEVALLGEIPDLGDQHMVAVSAGGWRIKQGGKRLVLIAVPPSPSVTMLRVLGGITRDELLLGVPEHLRAELGALVDYGWQRDPLAGWQACAWGAERRGSFEEVLAVVGTEDKLCKVDEAAEYARKCGVKARIKVVDGKAHFPTAGEYTVQAAVWDFQRGGVVGDRV